MYLPSLVAHNDVKLDFEILLEIIYETCETYLTEVCHSYISIVIQHYTSVYFQVLAVYTSCTEFEISFPV